MIPKIHTSDLYNISVTYNGSYFLKMYRKIERATHPDPEMTRLRRSVLCLPASNDRAIAKLSSLAMDAVILDLEDSVADGMKEEGRKNISAYFSDRPPGDRETIIRVNDTSELYEQAMLLRTQRWPRGRDGSSSASYGARAWRSRSRDRCCSTSPAASESKAR